MQTVVHMNSDLSKFTNTKSDLTHSNTIRIQHLKYKVVQCKYTINVEIEKNTDFNS